MTNWNPYPGNGHDRLWNWFGMSYASWLTMPRVMMHAMPDEWQDKMAALCEEWDDTWNSQDMPSTQVRAVGEKGKLTKWPDWILNYRHPDYKEIDNIRREQSEHRSPNSDQQ